MLDLIGSTVWARQTLESKIFSDKPAEWFKIWFFLICRVNYKDVRQFKRGQCHTTYEEIMEYTKATHNQVDHCIRWLKQATMIATRKATRGFYVSVLNYAKFQDAIKNKSDTESDNKSEIDAKQKRNRGDTIVKELQEVNNITPIGVRDKNMFEEPTIQLDENGDEIQIPSKKTTFGKYPASIAKFYCELVGKTAGGRQLPAAKELLLICQDEFMEDTPEQWVEEIKGRIKVACKYYEIKGIKDWNLSKVGENWNKILTEWNKEVKKYQ